MTLRNIARAASSAVITTSLLAGGAAIAFAQNADTSSTTLTPTDTMTSSSTGATTTGPATPGIPNTGAGGDSIANMALLAVSALIAIGGGAYLARQRLATRS